MTTFTISTAVTLLILAAPWMLFGVIAIGALWQAYRKHTHHINNQRGVVLILSLMIMTVLLIMGLTFLMIALKESNISTNYKNHTAAFYVAEAGVEKAKNGLNLDPAYTGEPTTAFGSGTYDVIVEQLKPGLYRITGNGRVVTARSSIQVLVSRPIVPAFPFAAFAESSLELNNNTITDSYSCTDGSPGSEGGIGSNGNVTLYNNVVINGDANAGGFVTLNGNAVVSGVTNSGSAAVTLPSVDAGSGTGDLVIIDETITLAPGIYYFQDVSIEGTGHLKTSGQVTIFITGSLTMNKGKAGNIGGDPRDLSFVASYASATDTDLGVHLDSNAVLVGTIYGPDVAVHIDNNSIVYGSVVGRWIHGNNNSVIHFADCLMGGGETGKVKQLSWTVKR